MLIILFYLVLPITVLVIMKLGLYAILNQASGRTNKNNYIFPAFLFISVIPVQSILGFC